MKWIDSVLTNTKTDKNMKMKLSLLTSLMFLLTSCGTTTTSFQTEADVLLNFQNDYPELESLSKTTRISPHFLKKFAIKENYIPFEDSQEDFIKTIHVSVHIWQRADGTGNLIENNETLERFKMIEIWLDNSYHKNQEFSLPLPYETIYVEHPKLNIVIDSVYFYRDQTKDSSLFYCNNDYQHNKKLDKYLKENHPERLNSIPLHIVSGYYRTAWGFAHGGSILTFNIANGTDMSQTDMADYALSLHYTHEIGHALDLWHTYDAQGAWAQNCKEDYFDFLWDVYDTTAIKPCESRKNCDFCLIPKSDENNNIMGGGSAWYKSALQIGIMRRATVTKNFYNRKFEVRDFVTGYSVTPIRVTESEIWDFSLKFYQDLIIESGVILIVKDELQFSPNTRIIIQPEAKLILDGGILRNENYYQSTWEGVHIVRPINKEKAGVFEIINHGEIRDNRQ